MAFVDGGGVLVNGSLQMHSHETGGVKGKEAEGMRTAVVMDLVPFHPALGVPKVGPY